MYWDHARVVGVERDVRIVHIAAPPPPPALVEWAPTRGRSTPRRTLPGIPKRAGLYVGTVQLQLAPA